MDNKKMWVGLVFVCVVIFSGFLFSSGFFNAVNTPVTCVSGCFFDDNGVLLGCSDCSLESKSPVVFWLLTNQLLLLYYVILVGSGYLLLKNGNI